MTLYVTSVGGTSLTMNGSGASYASEQVWNWGNESPGMGGSAGGTGWVGSGFIGSAGGISPSYAIPSLAKRLRHVGQSGVHHHEEFPGCRDSRGELCQLPRFARVRWVGTSWAAPLWVGFMALVNQEGAANGQPPVGFLNPALYAVGKSSNYANCFHDITEGNKPRPPAAACSPRCSATISAPVGDRRRGSNLIYALALPQRLVIAPNSNLLFTGPVGGPLIPGASELLTDQLSCESILFAPLERGLDAAWLDVLPTNGTNLAGGPARLSLSRRTFWPAIWPRAATRPLYIYEP